MTLIVTQPLTDESWHKLEVNDYTHFFKNGRCISCMFSTSVL